MPARAMRWGMASAGLLALAFACGAQAQETPAYKCVSKGRVVYSQIPCAGARPIGSARPRVNVRYETPSQDRAKIARRATLSEAERHECTGLDARLRDQEAEVRSRGDAATLQDEMPLVHTRKRYRELKC
jgi:hypothetical protein